MMKIQGFLLILAVVLISSCKPEPTLNVRGIVIDSITQEPILGAFISEGSYAKDLKAGGVTDEAGHFSYFTYPEEHTISIIKNGYQKYKLTIGLTDGNKIEELYVELTPEP